MDTYISFFCCCWDCSLVNDSSRLDYWTFGAPVNKHQHTLKSTCGLGDPCSVFCFFIKYHDSRQFFPRFIDLHGLIIQHKTSHMH